MRCPSSVLIVANDITATVATAAGGVMSDDSTTDVSAVSEWSPRSAVLGRKVYEHLPSAASLRLDCVTAKGGARTVYTPPQKTSVHVVAGDGESGWESTCGGMRHCVGQTRTPTVECMKTMVVSGAIKHALGGREPSEIQTFRLSAVLSEEQLARSRSVCMTESASDSRVVKTEPAGEKRTCGWFRDCAQQRVSHDVLDVTWLALIAEGLGVNIMVWEPSGVDQEVQPYEVGSVKGLFMCGKKDKIDEAGDHWVHLLYRSSADPWAARAGVATAGRHARHNHFDWLQLGDNAAELFAHIIAKAQEQLQYAEAPAAAEVTDRSKPKVTDSASAPDPPQEKRNKISLEGKNNLPSAGAPTVEKK